MIFIASSRIGLPRTRLRLFVVQVGEDFPETPVNGRGLAAYTGCSKNEKSIHVLYGLKKILLKGFINERRSKNCIVYDVFDYSHAYFV